MQFLEEIYQKYALRVYKYLLSLCHNEDMAEEIMQETFYQAIKSIDRYDGSCAVSTWLCAIAKNQLLSYQRKYPYIDSLEELNSSNNLKKSNSFENSTQSKQLTQSAEENAFQALDRIELMKKLHSCPEPFREVLYLRIFGNLAFREIGEIMGKTENWARVTFYRGKEKLRKEIGEDEE